MLVRYYNQLTNTCILCQASSGIDTSMLHVLIFVTEYWTDFWAFDTIYIRSLFNAQTWASAAVHEDWAWAVEFGVRANGRA